MGGALTLNDTATAPALAETDLTADTDYTREFTSGSGVT